MSFQAKRSRRCSVPNLQSSPVMWDAECEAAQGTTPRRSLSSMFFVDSAPDTQSLSRNPSTDGLRAFSSQGARFWGGCGRQMAETEQLPAPDSPAPSELDWQLSQAPGSAGGSHAVGQGASAGGEAGCGLRAMSPDGVAPAVEDSSAWGLFASALAARSEVEGGAGGAREGWGGGAARASWEAPHGPPAAPSPLLLRHPPSQPQPLLQPAAWQQPGGGEGGGGGAGGGWGEESRSGVVCTQPLDGAWASQQDCATLQEQFWAGAYPPARGGRVRRSQYDAPPARPSSPLLLRPVSAPAENGDVTRTPCRPSQLMDGAELVLSPGEGGGSQYIHSPLPAHLDVPAEAQNTRPHAHETECHGFGALSRPPLFPLFQPRGIKKLHLVRHGESEYNAACAAPGSSWDEPCIFDAPLTPRGHAQAHALGHQLAQLVGAGAVWVCSPLTRAIQTCLLARAAVTRCAPDLWSSPARGSAWLSVRGELSEHLVTSGDVGRPACQLAQAFPELAEAGAFAQLPDTWWYSQAGKPNCCATRQLGQGEPRQAFLQRVGAFRKWVLAHPERELVVFGHSTFFKYLAQQEGLADRRLRNCEILTLQL